MRISVEKDDPGYSNDTMNCKVFCDDVEVPYCLTADEEHGIIWYMVLGIRQWYKSQGT